MHIDGASLEGQTAPGDGLSAASAESGGPGWDGEAVDHDACVAAIGGYDHLRPQVN